MFNDVAADKTGAAGDEDFHINIFDAIYIVCFPFCHSNHLLWRLFYGLSVHFQLLSTSHR